METQRSTGSAVHFDTSQAARIVGVSPQRVRQCVGAGVVRPARDRRGHLRFGFVDLVLLRTMRGLLDKSIPLRRVGRVLQSLRRQIGERPLTRLTVYADGERVVAWDGATRWQPDSGQFLFNFEAAQVVRGARKVARLRPPAGPQRAHDVSADEWYDLGIELEDSSPLEAREAYHHALDLDPAHAKSHINLGRLLHHEENLVGAEHHYRQAIGADPNSALAWYNLGVLLEDQKLVNEPLYCYERAVQAEREFADAHYNLALLYERTGRRREAVRHLAIYRRLTRRRR